MRIPSVTPAFRLTRLFVCRTDHLFFNGSVEYTSIPADKTFALTAEMYMDPLKMYAKAAQTKWGGTLPAAEDQQTVEKTGMLGMSQSTTIKAAVGVGGEYPSPPHKTRRRIIASR